MITFLNFQDYNEDSFEDNSNNVSFYEINESNINNTSSILSNAKEMSNILNNNDELLARGGYTLTEGAAEDEGGNGEEGQEDASTNELPELFNNNNENDNDDELADIDHPFEQSIEELRSYISLVGISLAG